MPSRNPKHTPRHPATRKARSPSHVASRTKSYGFQLTSFHVERPQVLGNHLAFSLGLTDRHTENSETGNLHSSVVL